MKVLTFGEALFRLSTERGERFPQADQMDFFLGGTELNIAANLKSLGVETEWVSCLPGGKTGELMRERIVSLGIDISHVPTIANGRPGWYLMETGAAPRPDVVLGRFASSLADQNSYPFEWRKILSGAQLFHTSGVSSGLSESMTLEVKKAMETARALKIPVSYDFNYRKHLWTAEESVRRQKDLFPFINILFCSMTDLELFFGKDVQMKNIFEKYPLEMIILTERNADETTYGVKVVTRTTSHASVQHRIHLIDRIGIGDSMAAGFIASWLKDKDIAKAAEFGAIAGAMKYGIKGDMALLRHNEIETVLTQGYRGISR
ncbi:MAG: sugar kinase [Bdellovibrionota bacterium]